MNAPDYLACTKAPPRDLPPLVQRMGLGSCVAPRNHPGPCEFSMEGGGRMVLRSEPLPEDLIASAVVFERKARRAYKTSLVCSIISAMSAGWLLADVIRSVGG